jgi:hypothetical protein
MELEKLNLVELNAQEVEEVVGGGLFGLIGIVAFFALAFFYQKNNPNNTNVDWTPGPYYPSGNAGDNIVEAYS